jgi:hypothetical protein
LRLFSVSLLLTMQSTADILTPTKLSPKSRPRRSMAYQQAVKIERILTETILDPNTPAQSRASCAAAWTRVQEAKRILRGKPLPGQLRPELEQMRKLKRKQSELLAAFAAGPVEEPPAAAS